MKQAVVGLTVVLLLGVAVAGPILGAVAQDGTPTVADRHPLVGSWTAPGVQPSIFTFFAEGIMIATDEDGRTWHGVWRPNGEAEVVFLINVLVSSSGTRSQGIQGYISLGPDQNYFMFDGNFMTKIVLDPSDILPPASPTP